MFSGILHWNNNKFIQFQHKTVFENGGYFQSITRGSFISKGAVLEILHFMEYIEYICSANSIKCMLSKGECVFHFLLTFMRFANVGVRFGNHPIFNLIYNSVGNFSRYTITPEFEPSLKTPHSTRRVSFQFKVWHTNQERIARIIR